MKLILKDH